jgi:hypothetical protein
MRTFIIVIALLILTITGILFYLGITYKERDWTPQLKEQAIIDCMKGVGNMTAEDSIRYEILCDCVLTRIAKKYSYSEYYRNGLNIVNDTIAENIIQSCINNNQR